MQRIFRGFLFCFLFFFCLRWKIVLMWFQLGTFRLVDMNDTIVCVIGHHYIRRLKEYCAEIWTGYLVFNSYKYSVKLREWNLFLETERFWQDLHFLGRDGVNITFTPAEDRHMRKYPHSIRNKVILFLKLLMMFLHHVWVLKIVLL